MTGETSEEWENVMEIKEEAANKRMGKIRRNIKRKLGGKGRMQKVKEETANTSKVKEWQEGIKRKGKGEN